MKKITCFIIFCLLAGSGIAQTRSRSGLPMWDNRSSDTMTVFSHTAYIRSAPGTDAPITDSLSMGETITVLGKTSIYSTLLNLYAPWLSVAYTRNGHRYQGFMWEGLLALGQAANHTHRFLYGIKEIKTSLQEADTQLLYRIQLRVLNKAGIQIAVKEWSLPEGESLNYSELKLLGDTRLRNVTEVARLMFGGEACGIPSDYYYTAFTGAALLDLPGKMCVGDAGVFHHEETLLFPNEKGGKEGQIIRITEEEEVLEDETATRKARVKKTGKREVYSWDGSKATLVQKGN